jgi:CheY-like chemotaxis protein
MRRSILVVDDDPHFLQSLSILLEEREYTVYQASSLDEAIAQLRQNAPPLVLLDLKLADVDPSEVIAGAQRANATTAIILCSGYPGLLDELAESASSSRVVGTVRKPFQIDQLTGMLDALLH